MGVREPWSAEGPRLGPEASGESANPPIAALRPELAPCHRAAGQARKASGKGSLTSNACADRGARCRSYRALRILKAVGTRSDADREAAGADGGSVEINRPPRAGLEVCGRLRQRHQLASRCLPDAPVAARTGPGRRHHPRGTGAAGHELAHRRQHRPGRGRPPAHLACPRSAEAAARISAGRADRPRHLPLHRGGGGPSARSVATSGAAGGVAAPTAGHRRPPTPQTPAGDAAGHQRTRTGGDGDPRLDPW
jgi:hypothetical protein